jgi:hypothetical protein
MTSWLTMAAVLGLTVGAAVYHMTQPGTTEYKPTMTRAVTITGQGQFKCQTGC